MVQHLAGDPVLEAVGVRLAALEDQGIQARLTHHQHLLFARGGVYSADTPIVDGYEGAALRQAEDALEAALSFCVDGCKPLPVAMKPRRGQRTVRLSALEGAKLGVYQAMTQQGIKKSELARRLGWHMPQVDRLFDPSELRNHRAQPARLRP